MRLNADWMAGGSRLMRGSLSWNESMHRVGSKSLGNKVSLSKMFSQKLSIVSLSI